MRKYAHMQLVSLQALHMNLFDFQMSDKGGGEARHRLSRHAQVGGGSSRGVLARGERGEVDDRAQVLRQPKVEELDQVGKIVRRFG